MAQPSCTCLHDLTSLEKLYSYDTYKDINVTDKLPMCDKQSRMIDGKGDSWCYVHRHSDCCGDNQESSKYPHVDYSYQACQKPKTQGTLHSNGLYFQTPAIPQLHSTQFMATWVEVRHGSHLEPTPNQTTPNFLTTSRYALNLKFGIENH